MISLVIAQRAGNEEGEIDDFLKSNNSAESKDEPKVTI